MMVLFLTDSLSDLDGVGRYTIRLISAMEKLRPELEVHVLLARKHRPTSTDVPKHWKIEVGLPPDYFFYMTPLRFAASLLLAVKRVRSAAKSAALVHAIKDYPHSLAGSLGARLAGKPCIATAHGTYTIQPLRSAKHARHARRLMHKISHIISVSRYTKKRLLEEMAGSCFDESKVSVVPNRVAAEHYLAPRELPGTRPWHAVPFTLGIGEVKERKGHHLALEAWLRVAQERTDLHHFIVGNHSAGDEYFRGLQSSAEAAGCGDRVHFLGNVSEDEKVDLLQRAEVFIHTPVTASDGGFEGFGIVYLEASASGTPVLGTLDCGAEDAILDEETGLLCAQEPDAVEAGLKRLLLGSEASSIRARMAEAGRKHAAASSWEENAARVLGIYDEALGRPKKSS